MGIYKFRYAMLLSICGLAMAATANAQSGTAPAASFSAPSASFSAPSASFAAPSTSFSTPSQLSLPGGAQSVVSPSYFDTSPVAHGGGGGGGASCGCGTGGCTTRGCGGGGGLGGITSACNHGDQWQLFGGINENTDYNIGGWFQFGYHTESNDLFNSHPDQLNLQQAWLFAEKVATPRDGGGLGWGWRFDAVYGVDGPDTQAFGNSLNAAGDARGFDNPFDFGAGFGWAIPQLYLEVAGENWSAKVGHFYTLIGYEVVTAPDNFFYSHAITNFNSEPFTHTGAIGTFNVSDDFTLYGGWTLGWDTGFDQFDDGSAFLGGFSTSIADNSSLTYITTIGDFGFRGDDGYNHSIVVDTQVTDRFNWVVQSDYLRVDGTGEDNIGLNQYFLYSISDCWGVGSRVEWWKGDSLTGYAPHGGILPATGSHSYYAATFGVNYKPNANIILRPEYRFDWSPALGYDEGYFGVDLIALY